MAERDALDLHHPIHRRALGAAAEAVEDVTSRIDRERRILVRPVEGTAATQVLTELPQLDPPRLRQPLERHLRLDPLQLLRSDPRHSESPGRRPCQEVSAFHFGLVDRLLTIYDYRNS